MATCLLTPACPGRRSITSVVPLELPADALEADHHLLALSPEQAEETQL